ncbi:tetratricopeptide repeat protein, partial [bacterium]|nr:tetratricopeptide repeat protein [bacterium]
KAIEVYKSILRNWPYYHYAPVIQQKIVACYEKNSDNENAMAALDEMVQQFGPGSSWISNQKKAELKDDAMTQSEKALLDYASHYHSLGQEQKKRADYQVAIEKYIEFLEKFPHSSMAAEVNFRLAECLYEIVDFKQAASSYWNVVKKYGQTEFLEDAAYNRIICYQNLIDQNSGISDSSVIYLEGFLGKKKTLPQRIRIQNPYQKDFLISSNDFVVLLPKVERAEDVLVKFAETLYSLKEYGLAAKVYSRAVRDFQNGKYFSQAYSMLAQSHLKAGNYNAASAISRKIEKLFPDQPELILKAKNWAASSGLKKAEELARSKQPLKAAVSFARAAMSTSDPEIARISIFRAAAQYDSLGKAITAAHTLERFLKEKQNTPYGAEISYQAAVFREKREDWNLAFEDYNQVVEKHPQSDLAGAAYLNAAHCLEEGRKFAQAENYYDKYVTQDWKNKTPDKVILALYKSAEMKHKQKKLRAAEIGYQKTVQQYVKYMKQRMSVDDYYAAKSQHQLAKIGFENFMKYEIKEPIEQTIQQKKALFALTIRNYSNVLKFKIAEFSTEAFYKIGLSYELFAAAMASIPLPGISAEDAAVQRAAVTKPLKQEAIKYYRSNLKMAKNGKIKDEWVDESRKRERKLNRELGIVPKPVKKQVTTKQAGTKQVLEKTDQPPKKRAKRLRTRSEAEKSQ